MKFWHGLVLIGIALVGIYFIENPDTFNRLRFRFLGNPGARTVGGYLSAIENRSPDLVDYMSVDFFSAASNQDADILHDWKILYSEYRDNSHYVVKVVGKNLLGLPRPYYFKVQRSPTTNKLQIVDSWFYLRLPPAEGYDMRWDMERYMELRDKPLGN